ncbi:DUF952 domain-containing protein [Legionella tunisiensis]|uniref:DUF952 domain-containing protein n=1 Tax=Legionella tunisiensis TaxID=1034944 RepID=UPI0002FC0C7E|nr:DUF952 domain-containing protein [Legionella tunisiensis]
MTFVYKILTVEEWNAFEESGSFEGSVNDKKDGFIHLTFEHQYPAILEKFFKGINEVVLVEIDSRLLEKDTLKIEANKPGGEKYPHLYSILYMKAVTSHRELSLPEEPRAAFQI